MQTWDWYDAMSDGWFTWTIPHPDGRVVQTVTEFGMLAKIGVNDRGVGVMLNMLHHRNDAGAVAGGEIGHPVHLLSRAILDDAASVDEAVAIASAPRTSASTSLTVVDDRGGAVVHRAVPRRPGLSSSRPTACWCAPTTSSPTAGRDGCLASTISVSTELRRDHLVAAFAAAVPQTTQDVYDAMTHHLADGGVCRHPLTDTDPVLWHRTLATVGIDVDRPAPSTCTRTAPAGTGWRPSSRPARVRQADLARLTASSSSGDIAWSHAQVVMFLA